MYYSVKYTLKNNSGPILKCISSVTRTQATGEAHYKIKILKKKSFPCLLSSLKSHPCDSRSELLGVHSRYREREHMHTNQSSLLTSYLSTGVLPKLCHPDWKINSCFLLINPWNQNCGTCWCVSLTCSIYKHVLWTTLWFSFPIQKVLTLL